MCFAIFAIDCRRGDCADEAPDLVPARVGDLQEFGRTVNMRDTVCAVGVGGIGVFVLCVAVAKQFVVDFDELEYVGFERTFGAKHFESEGEVDCVEDLEKIYG